MRVQQYRITEDDETSSAELAQYQGWLDRHGIHVDATRCHTITLDYPQRTVTTVHRDPAGAWVRNRHQLEAEPLSFPGTWQVALTLPHSDHVRMHRLHGGWGSPAD